MTTTERQGARLSELLVELQVTPYKFSKDLGYKSPDSIYAILNGQTGFSGRFFERLKESYPNINLSFLIDGYGEKFIKKIRDNGLGTSVPFYPAELSYEDLKYFSLDIMERELTLSESDSIIIRARRALTRGVEFDFTEYSFFDDKKIIDKIYTLVLQPDWQVVGLFDHWRIYLPDSPGRGRCQNLLELSPNSSITFNNIIYELFERQEPGKKYQEINSPFLQDDNWTEIYCNDPRVKQFPYNEQYRSL